MPQFDYARAKNLGEALTLLATAIDGAIGGRLDTLPTTQDRIVAAFAARSIERTDR